MCHNNKCKITLINRTDVSDETVMSFASKACNGQDYPGFYLICQTPNHDGLTITNLDKPCIIITIISPTQFYNTLKHELTHLKQHAKGYANEQEAEKAEVIITDKHKIRGK